MNRKLLVTLPLFALALSNAVASLAHAKASAPICLTGINVYKPCSRPGGN